MSSRHRISIATIVASLAILTGLARKAAATELAKQAVINNATATAVPGTSGGEQWARSSSAFDNPRIDNAGNVVFGGVMNTSSPGGVVVTANRRGVWYGGTSPLQLIARDGTTTPVAPVTAGLPLTNPNGWWLNSTANGTGLASIPTLSPNGTMFILGQLNGTGATAINNTAFWTGQAGSVGIVAQRGVLPAPYGVAPGTGGLPWNTNLNSSQAGVNNAGQVMFQSALLPGEQRNLSSLVASGTTVSGTTFAPHGYAIGTTVVITGATPTRYNGVFTVTGIPTTTTFTFAYPTSARTVTALSGNGTSVIATTSVAHGFAVGNTVDIVGATPAGYNGSFVITAVPSATTFVFGGSTTGASSGTITATYGLPVRTVTTLSGASGTVTATTSVAHGFAAGNTVVIAGATPAGYNGTFVILTASGTTFTYANATTGASSGTITASVTSPSGTIVSSTGNLNSLVGSGTTVTATTTNTHGYLVGQTIVIAGATPTNYNGTFLVTTAPDATTFTYTYTPTIRTVNALSGNGTTVTATTSAAHGFVVGNTVEIAGASPDGYNGTFVIATVPSSTTFTYANATTGVSLGTITATVTVPTGTLTVTRGNTDGLWIGSPSGINLVMQKDDVAPGLGDPNLRMDATPAFGLLINGSGTVAFITKLKLGSGTTPVTTDTDYVMCTGTPGAMSIIARENDVVPGLGGPQYQPVPASTFSPPWTILTAGLSNDNSLYFFSGLGGSGVNTGVDDLAIFKYSSGTTTLVMRKGDSAPGMPGVTFSSWNFGNSRANNNGTLLLASVLTGAGISSGVNNESLWILPVGGPAAKIVQTGDVLNLPDLPANTVLSGSAGLVSSAQAGLNNLGQVVFNANLAGPGITAGVNSSAVLAWDPVGGLMLVALMGNDYGIVTASTQITPNPVINGEGTCAGFSDTGWLALIIGNSNTSNYAVFRTQVVAQGACCHLDGSACTMTTQTGCPAGDLWRSDLTSCSVSCPAIGSCCYIDGTCALRFQVNCTGTSWVAGGTCTPNTCPVAGACCNATTGLCSFVPLSLCPSPNLWTEGVACANVQCLGSCCDPAYGSCMMSLKVDCVTPKIWTLGGTCSPNGCAQPLGACCKTDGTCVQATPGDCDTIQNSVRWSTGACGTCPGIPNIINTGLSGNTSGLSPDGQTVTSALFHGDTAISGLHKYVRGTGYSTLTGAYAGQSPVRCTNLATVVASDQIDTTNLSGLSPAFNRTLARRYTTAGGWAPLGATGAPTVGSPNACDFTINGTDGFSDNGQYIAASGWSGSQCGPFKIWRFDNTATAWTELPRSTTGTQDRAYAMSGDGSTVVGWDQTGQYRNAAVWTYSSFQGTWTATVLDTNPIGSEVYGVNNNGTAIVGYMSPAGMTAAFGTTDRTPIRWTRTSVSSNTWIRTNLGGVDGMIPIAVSNDGNTIVGVAGTASDAWIWKPHMAAPMDLATYLTRTGVDLTALGIVNFGTAFTRGLTSMSRDGNVLLGTYSANTPCLTTGGTYMLTLNGTGVACEPPHIIYPPVSQDYTTFSLFGGILNCLHGGTLGLTYQWQKQDPTNPLVWNDLSDDNCSNFNFFAVKGSQGPQLRLGMWANGANNDLRDSWGTYRCVVTGACSPAATTSPATIRMGGACCFPDGSCRVLFQTSSTLGALGCSENGGVFRGNFTSCDVNPCLILGDLNCDNILNGLDIQAFTLAVTDPGTYGATYPGCNILAGDTNHDTVVDPSDIPSFMSLLTGP